MSGIVNLVAQTLQRRIRSGEFAPGAALPSQRELAASMSISRTSLREAISTLEALGLVRSLPGKGVFVSAGLPPVQAPRGTAAMSPQQLFELRLVLEPAWTRLAARRIDEAGYRRLEALQQGMEAALKVCDLVMAADWDLKFHLCLAELSANPGLDAIALQFGEQIGHSLRLPFSNPAALWAPLDEHRLIVAALAQGDADAAGRAMHEHLASAALRAGIEVSFPHPQGVLS